MIDTLELIKAVVIVGLVLFTAYMINSGSNSSKHNKKRKSVKQ